MAKTYGKVFSSAKQTLFGIGTAPILALASANTGVQFNPTGTNSTQGTGIDYAIQVVKRGKASDTAARTGAAGDDFVTDMNSAQRVDWETIDTKRGAERKIIFKVAPGEEVDFLDMAEFQRPIAARTEARMIEGEEKAITTLVTASGASVGTLDLAAADPLVEAKKIREQVRALQMLSDEYKHYSKDVIVYIHPLVADLFADLEGLVYRNAKDVFAEGKEWEFKWSGIKFATHEVFNSIETATAGHVVGALVMDTEAYANAGLDNGATEFDQEFFGDRFVGHKYSELDAVVFPNRVKHLEIANIATAKVND